jgi:cytochrome c5
VTKQDSVFLKHFVQLILGLMAFALVLMYGAYRLHDRFYGESAAAAGLPDDQLNPIQRERVAAHRAEVDARLAPLAKVNAGDTGRAAILAAEEAAKLAAAGQVAYGGTLDGSVIYQNLCSACHNSGAGGAPMLTKDVWAPRVAQGVDMLVKHAVEGFQGAAGIMPAKGGNPALTDEQVKATVEFMLGKVQ